MSNFTEIRPVGAELVHTDIRTDEGPHTISVEGSIYDDLHSVATNKIPDRPGRWNRH